jgi:hypothetical protein
MNPTRSTEGDLVPETPQPTKAEQRAAELDPTVPYPSPRELLRAVTAEVEGAFDDALAGDSERVQVYRPGTVMPANEYRARLVLGLERLCDLHAKELEYEVERGKKVDDVIDRAKRTEAAIFAPDEVVDDAERQRRREQHEARVLEARAGVERRKQVEEAMLEQARALVRIANFVDARNEADKAEKVNRRLEWVDELRHHVGDFAQVATLVRKAMHTSTVVGEPGAMREILDGLDRADRAISLANLLLIRVAEARAV